MAALFQLGELFKHFVLCYLQKCVYTQENLFACFVCTAGTQFLMFYKMLHVSNSSSLENEAHRPNRFKQCSLKYLANLICPIIKLHSKSMIIDACMRMSCVNITAIMHLGLKQCIASYKIKWWTM